MIGTERLLLVCLWRPVHDGSHAAGAASAAAANGSYLIAPPRGGRNGDTSGGALAFRLEARSLLRHAEAELLDVTGLRLHELHRLRRAGMMLRTMWRRAAGSLLVPGAAEDGAPGLQRMDTATQMAAATPGASGSGGGGASGRATREPLWGSGGGGSAGHGGGGSGGRTRSRSASPPALTPPSMGLAAAARREMVDAATSARPLHDVALSEVPVLRQHLLKSMEEAEAYKTQLALAKDEAREVSEENRWVREALDESRERLSAMAEELAATRAALRARDMLDAQAAAARRDKAGAGGKGGIASALLGCVGGRDNLLKERQQQQQAHAYAAPVARLANRDPLSHPTPLPLPAPHASPPRMLPHPTVDDPAPFEVMSDAGDSGSWDARAETRAVVDETLAHVRRVASPVGGGAANRLRAARPKPSAAPMPRSSGGARRGKVIQRAKTAGGKLVGASAPSRAARAQATGSVGGGGGGKAVRARSQREVEAVHRAMLQPPASEDDDGVVAVLSPARHGAFMVVVVVLRRRRLRFGWLETTGLGRRRRVSMLAARPRRRGGIRLWWMASLRR